MKAVEVVQVPLVQVCFGYSERAFEVASLDVDPCPKLAFCRFFGICHVVEEVEDDRSSRMLLVRLC